MTHPFHPLAGKSFEFVCRRRNWEGDWVYYFDGSGALCWLPARWTDVVAPHPVVVLGNGCSWFVPEDLLQLAALVTARRSAPSADL